MIPKVIHFCWFGGKRKPRLIKDCIRSWKRYLPDYEIIEWNEENSDLSHPFVKEAYELKKWAFVSDYIRLKALYDFGGIYLDTDMMVLKSFDSLLINTCFFGAEDSEFISCGIIGCLPNNSFINACIEEYNFIEFEKVTNFWEISIPRIITRKFRNLYGFRNDFNTTVIESDIKIFPPLYFYPFPYKDRERLNNYRDYIRGVTFTVHLWSSSWVEYSEFQYFANREYFKGFCKMTQHLYKSREFKYVYFRRIVATIKSTLIK